VPKTVLLVEDEAHLRIIYSAALEASGYSVLVARHGAEGVCLARRRHPDLILMDLSMPVMDGRTAIRYLKLDPETASIPVCAISGYLHQAQADDAQRVEFDRCLTKPVEPRQIVAAVESHIGPVHPALSPQSAARAKTTNEHSAPGPGAHCANPRRRDPKPSANPYRFDGPADQIGVRRATKPSERKDW
jgi:CheY-like chemotaxis protein